MSLKNFDVSALLVRQNESKPVESILDYANIDLTNAIECKTDEDCPSDSTCPSGNIQMAHKCMCVQALTPAKKNETCRGSTGEGDHDGQSGVIRFPSNFGLSVHGLSDNHTFETNTHSSQTKSARSDRADQEDQTTNLTYKVVIPLAAVFFLTAVLLFVLIRHFKWCQKRKRTKATAIVVASEGVNLLDKIIMVNKNPTYFVGNAAGGPLRLSTVVNIPTDRLRLMEVVGEGAFGQVYRGELESDDDGATMVAVKVLKEGVTNEVREDFEREVEIMSAFDHENILKLLGTVQTGTDETPYMVFEYMLHGDLAELLRKNDPSIRQEKTLLLERIDLIDITTQIANGMKYLTSQHFVHRDLATRNCLVGEGLTVKISDFGMSRDIYTCDYYRIGGSRMLPVRWMSPEAVKWGRFTTDSDIWAFGVVLWESFSFGRQPYYGHSNEEVIKFLEENILLQRPDECPSVVYHVMLQCWKIDPKERLAFDRIHKYLQEYHKQLQKNVGNVSFELVNEYEIPI
ncbi:tyrosine-protein kinase transmembrane receptor Ror-like [Dreissena polymorpha]|uniref:tyrosine-protein kinase transmembrane receptor Ror-like n=1 Tax=Dreissena polymorpha TaxID=45954 RepID=UPI00226406BE|nr:tyrosine-protein kinase transmembrane receptor Ror-like [Dreissena polymorpha]XP_052237243.1 tyrosine-protein kinase transmembrane receptor Ror-like [Dreissena polymorpha]